MFTIVNRFECNHITNVNKYNQKYKFTVVNLTHIHNVLIHIIIIIFLIYNYLRYIKYSVNNVNMSAYE
jgi:hypothetical protein